MLMLLFLFFFSFIVLGHWPVRVINNKLKFAAKLTASELLAADGGG